jgi:hypothetical protein
MQKTSATAKKVALATGTSKKDLKEIQLNTRNVAT